MADDDVRKDALSPGERTVLQPDGELRNVGALPPGVHRLSTESPERVEITQGRCRVKLADTQEWAEYGAGESFHVPGGTHYDIEVAEDCDFVVHYGDVEPPCGA